MNEDMSDLINKLNSMIGSDSADNLNNIINNISNNSNGHSSSKTSSTNNSDTEDNTNNLNIDFETIMKMKSLVEAFNSKKDDPRARLLMSLKPYLKESRKNKVDQYIQLLNMSSVFEAFKENGGDLNNIFK